VKEMAAGELSEEKLVVSSLNVEHTGEKAAAADSAEGRGA
jgi:hypothetical protein